MVARHFLTLKKRDGAAPHDMISVYNLLDSDMFSSLKSVIQLALNVPVSVQGHSVLFVISTPGLREPWVNAGSINGQL